MTTDRELLEAAAKEAGLDLQHKPLFSGDAEPGYYDYSGGTPKWTWWNPLTDDGDAFRLAVKLRLDMQISDYGTSARNARDFTWHGCAAHLHGGIEAATRLAIVRAAAALGASK